MNSADILSPASAHSIQSWVERLPATFEAPPSHTTRKRKAPPPADASSALKRKRTALASISRNVHAMPAQPRTPVNPTSSSGRKESKRVPPISPQDTLKPSMKLQNTAHDDTHGERQAQPSDNPHSAVVSYHRLPRLGLDSAPTFTAADMEETVAGGDAEEHDEVDELDDLGETPRARGQGRDNFSDAGSQASSAISQSSSQKPRQSRASSPVKMADLRPLDIRLQHLPPATDISHTHDLAPLRDLLLHMDNYSLSFAFLPASARRELQSCRELNRDYFYDISPHREGLGKVLRADDVLQIYEGTIEGKIKSVSEPEWNTSVHYPLLRAALRNSTHCRRLEIHTITTAKVSLSCLPITNHSGESSISGRHVDFAISLKSYDTPLEDFYTTITKEWKSSRRTFNQTDDASVAETPFAVSIETKPFNTVRLEDGRCQISMWALAQFRKAAMLQAGREGMVEYMPLPMLSVAGPDWRMFVAVKDRVSGKMNLYEGTTIASTDSKPGIYRIDAALQLLMDWAEKVYRPWFESILSR